MNSPDPKIGFTVTAFDDVDDPLFIEADELTETMSEVADALESGARAVNIVRQESEDE